VWLHLSVSAHGWGDTSSSAAECVTESVAALLCAACLSPTHVGEMQKSTETTVGVSDATSVRAWPEAPLDVTLWPTCRRRRVHYPLDGDESIDWWSVLVAAVLGLCAGVAEHGDVCMWACGSTGVGLVLLAANRHYPRTVCAALSLNFWCAAAWIGCAVSPTLGVVLTVTAAASRCSVCFYAHDFASAATRARNAHPLTHDITAKTAVLSLPSQPQHPRDATGG
jgi:hypothetical protein